MKSKTDAQSLVLYKMENVKSPPAVKIEPNHARVSIFSAQSPLVMHLSCLFSSFFLPIRASSTALAIDTLDCSRRIVGPWPSSYRFVERLGAFLVVWQPIIGRRIRHRYNVRAMNGMPKDRPELLSGERIASSTSCPTSSCCLPHLTLPPDVCNIVARCFDRREMPYRQPCISDGTQALYARLSSGFCNGTRCAQSRV